jgi:predicted glycosyltransferase
MKIWYDACTGKQIRYAVAIAERLRALGHELILTTRSHPDTLALAKLLKTEFVNVGKYDPSSLYSMLKESSRRQLLLCKMFEKTVPDVAISHRSVELCRVAFGLGIPNIATHDTEIADAINRLTMQLIDFLVVSKALPKHFIEGYGIKKIFRFDGVDEVAWIKNFKPAIKYDYKRPLIIVRELEAKAAYAKGKENISKAIAKKLNSLGNVLFLPRYQKKPEKGLIVPDEFIDAPSLVSQADLVIVAGGTMTREASLLGVPTIALSLLGRYSVNDYLSKKGFPLFTVTPDKVFSYSKRLLGKKFNVKHLVDSLENPVDIIEKVIKEIEAEKMNKK